MPRYFFNIRYRPGPDGVAIDPEGNELPDLDAARDHALTSARDLMATKPTFLVRDWTACSFEIEDADAQRVLTVPFGDTVPDPDADEV